MSYQKANGQTAKTFDLGLNAGFNAQGLPAFAAAGTVVAATGVVGVSKEIGDRGTVRLKIVTTSNPTTITFVVETSSDDAVADAYRNVVPSTGAAIAAITANGTVYVTLAGVDRFVRVRCSAVTGSWTGSIVGEAA